MAQEVYAIYKEAKIPAGTMTLSEAKETMIRFYPELATAEVYKAEDGNIYFRATGGTKGVN